MLHIGRKAPKGFHELGPAMHLGKGVWIMRVERDPVPTLTVGTSSGASGSTIYAQVAKSKRPTPRRKGKA